MKQLAPCCVRHWKTAPCLHTTAPMASNKTRVDVSSASVSVVSSLLSLYVNGPKRLKCQGVGSPKKKKSVMHFFWHAASCSFALKYETDSSRFTCLLTLMANNFGNDLALTMHIYSKWCMSMAAAFASPENVPVSSLVVTPAFDGLLRPRSFDLSLNSFRWLLPRHWKILFPAMPNGIREGRLWLWGVRVQHPSA